MMLSFHPEEDTCCICLGEAEPDRPLQARHGSFGCVCRECIFHEKCWGRYIHRPSVDRLIRSVQCPICTAPIRNLGTTTFNGVHKFVASVLLMDMLVPLVTVSLVWAQIGAELSPPVLILSLLSFISFASVDVVSLDRQHAMCLFTYMRCFPLRRSSTYIKGIRIGWYIWEIVKLGVRMILAVLWISGMWTKDGSDQMEYYLWIWAMAVTLSTGFMFISMITLLVYVYCSGTY